MLVLDERLAICHQLLPSVFKGHAGLELKGASSQHDIQNQSTKKNCVRGPYSDGLFGEEMAKTKRTFLYSPFVFSVLDDTSRYLTMLIHFLSFLAVAELLSSILHQCHGLSNLAQP